MRIISLFSLPLILLIPFQAQAEKSNSIAIISEKDAKRFGFILPDKVSGLWTPSREDIARMDSAIKEHLESIIANTAIDSYEREKAKTVLEGFDSYWRQYIGITVEGEKRIFCNSGIKEFSPHHSWKSEPIFALDGGAMFWRIQYVPTENKCVGFNTNGEA